MNKVSKNRQKKEEIVDKISEKISRAKGLVFTNYQGLTHKQLEELKRALKDANAELVVTKNTLLKLSLNKAGVKADGNEEGFNNPTATIFAYEDVIAPLKHLAKTLKNLGLPTIKFGILDGQALNSDQLLNLASLPSREVLLAQVVGGLKSPIFGLHRALSWNIQKLVMTLKAVEIKKSV
ncbi:MAG: 50S ribosomal protein L10 [Patescibacteria group bacterium]